MPVGCYALSKSMSTVNLNVLREVSVFALKKVTHLINVDFS